MTLLSLANISAAYDDVDILTNVDLTVDSGEVVVIIGPNGAGKSTAMKSVFGLVKINAGRIQFDGEDITNLRPDQVVRRGVCYIPQEFNVFSSLTIHENLEMGAFLRDDDITADLERIYEMFPILRERRRLRAETLSGGQRQMLAMGRALMLSPKLLLLDEPTAGLAPTVISVIFDTVRKVNDAGVSILMVEQNAKHALRMADRGYVMVNGTTRMHDTGRNLLENKEVAELFLGGQG